MKLMIQCLHCAPHALEGNYFPHVHFSCHRGTLVHKSGDTAFARYATKTETARIRAEERDYLEAKLKAKCAEYCVGRKKAEDEDRQAATHNREFAKSANEVLEDRRLLQAMQGVRWAAFKHTCPAVAAIASAVDAQSNPDGRGNHSIDGLRNAWLQRHEGVRANNTKQPASTTPSVCFRAGTCFCGRQFAKHRALWTSAKEHIRATLPKSDREASTLRTGEVVLAWLGADSNAEDEAVFAECHFTAIPLHYFKPWKPTFLEMRCVDTDAFLQKLTVQGTEGEAITLAMSTETVRGRADIPKFRTPEQFVKSLDVSKNWSLRFLRLSSRCVPTSMLEPGHVRALVSSDAPLALARKKRPFSVLDIYGRKCKVRRSSEPQARTDGEDAEQESDEEIHRGSMEECRLLLQAIVLCNLVMSRNVSGGLGIFVVVSVVVIFIKSSQ
eukprot:5504964-Amphidinium_carterae.7